MVRPAAPPAPVQALIPCPELTLILPADFDDLPLADKAAAILARWLDLNTAYRDCRRRHLSLVQYARIVTRDSASRAPGPSGPTD